MEIKFDAEAAATVASAAIFDAMSQDQRDNVIRQAVEALLVPDKPDPYAYGSGKKKTALQVAFEVAIREAAMQAVREKVQNDPTVSQAIGDLLGPLLNAAMDAEAEAYDYTLATTLGDALGRWLADRAREKASNR